MLGFRGASRYVAAIVPRLLRAGVPRRCSSVRDEMGLTNVEIMVPFVRTLGRGAAGDGAAGRAMA